MKFNISPDWQAAYPGAFVGILAVRHTANPAHHLALDAEKTALEADLRRRLAGMDRPGLKALPILSAYHRYYKRFKKTYHVQLQLESVALKGKPIPRVAALVETMFMAELKNHLLTAVHDLDAVQPPVRIDVAGGGESFVGINGRTQILKAGDMYIADAQGILSNIIYGPDQRTQVTPETTAALFTVYAPPGIPETAVQTHLQDMERYVKLITPDAETAVRQVLAATPT